jgi:membrane fusion protein (multidrug efflux system)
MPDSGSPLPDTAAQEKSARVAVAGRRRRNLLALLGAVVLAGALAWGLYWFLVPSHYVETDNAYVGADTAQVTPLVSGQVAQVLVRETQTVNAGDPLVILDDADTRIALAGALAALGQAQRQVRGYFANDAALGAQVAARQAEISRANAQLIGAQADLARAQTDLQRRQALSASGAVSGDELTNAENRFASAQAALAAAKAAAAEAQATRGATQGTRDVNQTLIAGVTADQNPDVLAAQARVDAARLALSRTVIRAPMSGVVSKKAVEIGQQVAVGQILMAIVPISSAYVDANFKEAQLSRVRVGQPVTLTSDLYGGGVKFHGRVRGLSGGTGSAFSLIPAQNATGNWIKIVQRLPVRITLDPAELARHPLRVGLSMKASIDVADDTK